MKKIKFVHKSLLVIIPVIALVSLTPFAKATSSSAWLASSNPNLTAVESGANVPALIQGQPCQPVDMKYKKRTPFSNSEEWLSGSNVCMKVEPYGLFAGNSSLQLGDVGGPITDYGSNNLIPVPNSRDYLSTWTTANGLMRIKFDYNLPSHLDVMIGGNTNAPNGYISYHVNTPPQDALTDGNGNQLETNYNTLTFSSNGKYMVVDVPGKALIRVDLQTHQILPFESPLVSGGNFNFPNSIAISDDGSTVAVSFNNTFKIYDLASCAPAPAILTGPVSCDSKDLTSFISTNIPDKQSDPKAMSFIDNNSLVMYVNHGTSTFTNSKYILTAPGTSYAPQQYLALGDSYSSGEGSYSYMTGTDVSENRCHTSLKSYPFLLSAQNSYSGYHSVACSGARSDNITKWAKNPTAPANNSLGEWLPGLTKQIDKVKKYQPDVITLGVGGNDIGFSYKITACVVSPNACYNTFDSRTAIIDQVDNEYTKLQSTFSAVKMAAKHSTKIYVIGYPQIVNDDASASCGLNVRLNSEERTLANTLVDHLNFVISQAALSQGLKYVDVSHALDGHRFCDDSKNGIAMNGLGFIYNFKPIASESYHPNKLGQALLAQAIESATDNLSSYNISGTAVTPSRTSATAQSLLGPYRTPTYNAIKVETFNSEIPDTAYKSNRYNFSIDSQFVNLAPNSSYTVEFHSNPTPLGTFTTDSNGTLNVSAAIPSSLPVGIHTIHIYGTDLAGQPVDINQTVTVGATPGDFNGDSVPDTSANCPLVDGAPVDVDGDGIDDRCDPYIAAATSDILGLYRARQGIAANNEDPSKVYIERNTAKALSMYGISDYDPDSDGWSLVGVTDAGQQGSYANLKTNDVGPSINNYDEYLPTISIRSSENGCIQVTPSNLSAVTSTSSTSITTSATNTNTCRIEPPSADVNNNSTADQNEPLYRFRIGEASQGESTSDLYIERNITAAEAAFGTTDYDDNSDGWAKVAKFNTAGSYANIGLYNADTSALVISGATALDGTLLSQLNVSQRAALLPVVAIQDGLECKNYVPDSLGFVGQSQTRTAHQLQMNLLNCN